MHYFQNPLNFYPQIIVALQKQHGAPASQRMMLLTKGVDKWIMHMEHDKEVNT